MVENHFQQQIFSDEYFRMNRIAVSDTVEREFLNLSIDFRQNEELSNQRLWNKSLFWTILIRSREYAGGNLPLLQFIHFLSEHISDGLLYVARIAGRSGYVTVVAGWDCDFNLWKMGIINADDLLDILVRYNGRDLSGREFMVVSPRR